MPGIGEVIPAAVETAVVLVPSLLDVPIVGRILIAIMHGRGGDTHALEELQKTADKKKTERKTRIERNARYVIKASKAMECVEKHIMSGGLLLSLGKGIASAVLGKADTAPDILLDEIYTCIEENVLRQDTPRVKRKNVEYFARPRRGHGHGRKTRP